MAVGATLLFVTHAHDWFMMVNFFSMMDDNMLIMECDKLLSKQRRSDSSTIGNDLTGPGADHFSSQPTAVAALRGGRCGAWLILVSEVVLIPSQWLP